MLKHAMLTSAFALLAFGASAQEDYNYAPACVAPEPPMAVDGATATETQLAAGHDAVLHFMRVSDSYQSCLGLALGKQQNTAFFMHSNVPKHIVKQIEGRAADNQKQKERVAADYNAAVVAFRARTGAP